MSAAWRPVITIAWGTPPAWKLERPGGRFGTPGVRIEFFDRDRPAAARRADGNDVTREVPDHVAAGNPRGQRESLSGRIRFGDRAGDTVQMRFGPRRKDRVTDRRGHLG